MFDHLVESTAHHEDSARKGWFFAATLGIYVVLFAILIVAAIKGADTYMDTQNLADLKLITPVVVEEAAPVQQQKAEPQKQTQVKVEQQVATVREFVTDRPEVVQKGTSVTREGQSPPVPGAVKGKVDYIPPSGGSPFGDPNASGPPAAAPQPVVSDEPPPPPPKPTPTPRRAPISGGVLNGKAISLPKPPYPPIARAARAAGTVTVQVTIDESGKVISARAVGGHPLLQQAAVQAAYGARFSPTQLSGQPVKVTGVITYNFVAQ
ncbi:MAG: periplasmic protein TonB [Acidobacteriota bacterium]|jgi:protein TonB|nr:periplasmic protein TonB [Acidobacteriota bacterium]